MPQDAITAGAAAASRVAQTVRLQALHERREMLSEQYQSAMRERGQIGQERLNAQARGDAGMVREYESVVARIGGRMQELERSIQRLDQQIDEAMKAPLPVEVAVPGAPGEPAAITIAPPPFPYANELISQRIEFQRMMAAEGAILLALGALLWRFGVARGRRLATRAEAPRDDTKLQQAVDAIAIEVERLSEGQRFVTNILSTKRPERDVVPLSPRPLAEQPESTWITPH
jgi:hypothetical protein